MTGDEDDGRTNVGLGEVAWRSKPLEPGRRMSSTRQLGTAGGLASMTSAAEPKASHPEADRLKEIGERAPHRRIVIDDPDDRIIGPRLRLRLLGLISHDASLYGKGRAIWNVATAPFIGEGRKPARVSLDD